MTAIGNAGSGPAVRATSAAEPNLRTVRGHWICTALVGVSTSARRPIRRTISTPSSVLPDPGGAIRCVRRCPAARSRSNAASADFWYCRHAPPKERSSKSGKVGREVAGGELRGGEGDALAPVGVDDDRVGGVVAAV